MEVSGGYDVEGADTIPAKYKCQICLLILREPVQTLCGHRFCGICLNSLYDQQGEDIVCPIDRQTIEMETLFYDLAYEREILDTLVKCTNHKSGCNWRGELRDLEGHIKTLCTKENIQCPRENCQMMVFRSDLVDHMRNYCLYRIFNCDYCGDDYEFINEEYHESNCTKYPIPCNNNCGALKIPRNEIQEHLSKCPLTVVSCTFANVGCTKQFKRKLEKKHMKNHMHEHLHLTLVKTTQLETMYQEQRNLLTEYEKKSKILESKCETNSFIMTIETYYEKFGEALANGISLYSDPHIISGYKMRLQVSLNGQGDGEGTHMSVFFQLMKGKLDDYLKWPFDKLIDFVLIHQDDQSKCFTRTLTTAKNAETTRSTNFKKPVSDCNISRGYNKFITLTELFDGGFIKNDILFIRCVIGL